ncbi:MAG: ATP-binding cassette domain-containing protein [Rickettsiales bacterium]
MTKKIKKNTQPKFEIRGLSKRFGKKKVLDGLDLDVYPNESLVVVGGSGTGKSVLIKSIVGLINPDSGSVKYEGHEITSLNRNERNVLMTKFGFLFQGGALFDSMPVWENISFSMIHNKDIPNSHAKDVAFKKLKLVGLDPDAVMDLYPSELSGGMQKRVALARAIACDPEVIFFDEPTTGLDPIMANVINELIVRCREENNATTIAITHDINSTRRIADRVAMLYDGKIEWIGSVKEIDKPNDAIFKQFINGEIKGPIKVDLR